MPLTLKQGDSFPEIEVTCSDLAGPVDLTSASAIVLTLKSVSPAGTTVTLTATATLPQTGGNKGKAIAAIAVTDTATIAGYNAEVKVTWSVGQVQRFPNTGYETVTIEANLA